MPNMPNKANNGVNMPIARIAWQDVVVNSRAANSGGLRFVGKMEGPLRVGKMEKAIIDAHGAADIATNQALAQLAKLSLEEDGVMDG